LVTFEKSKEKVAPLIEIWMHCYQSKSYHGES